MNTINKSFLITLLGALPNMDEITEQGWIDNPDALKRAITEALCPPTTTAIKRFKEDENSCLAHRTALAFQQALDATGRRQDIDQDVVDNVPPELLCQRGKEVFLVPIHQRMYDDNVEETYGKDSYPCDPWRLCRLDCEGTFSDNKPYLTHWENADGEWCYVAFCNYRDERWVKVGKRNDINAGNGCWQSARVHK